MRARAGTGRGRKPELRGSWVAAPHHRPRGSGTTLPGDFFRASYQDRSAPTGAGEASSSASAVLAEDQATKKRRLNAANVTDVVLVPNRGFR